MKWRHLAVASISVLFTPGCVAGGAAEQPARAATAPVPAAAPGPRMAATEARPPVGPDGPITPALRGETIDAVTRVLGEKYVFPEKAAEVVKSIRARRARGEYDSIATGHALATTLTRHVNEILKDAHFGVRFSAEPLPPREKAAEPSREELARYAAQERRVNGGIDKVERLPGNIGYIEVRSFEFPKRGYEAAAAAMSFVSETDALIIDIRRNGGGEPDMVAALCSYFFAEPVHLNDLYYRPENVTRQYWTFPGVPGKRYVDRDVYVLTSRKTGSAAEEFAYNLKQQKRAKILGEVTWGGAHPGDIVRLNDHFASFVPTGRAINPISKTNWEGVGVKPDVEVPADDALRIAQIQILEKQEASLKDPELKRSIQDRLRELRGK